jgi:hypothetical protein
VEAEAAKSLSDAAPERRCLRVDLEARASLLRLQFCRAKNKTITTEDQGKRTRRREGESAGGFELTVRAQGGSRPEEEGPWIQDGAEA